jgi:hypothetical protein
MCRMITKLKTYFHDMSVNKRIALAFLGGLAFGFVIKPTPRNLEYKVNGSMHTVENSGRIYRLIKGEWKEFYPRYEP